MTEPDYQFHDARVVGLSVDTERQPIALAIMLRSSAAGLTKIIFERCSGIEGTLLGGVLAEAENFDFIVEGEVSQRFSGAAFAKATYEVSFTGGSRLWVTSDGYRIE
jgi:hypothetical protein